jgi:hypothetical protein
MKIILTENQLKDNVIHLIKKEGWIDTSEMVGLSRKEFAEIFFNNNPMEFLNIYNDLDITQSEEKPNWTLFRYDKGYNIMAYDRKNGIVYINYNEIWSFLQDGFQLIYVEIQQLTQRWLDETYKLRGIRTGYKVPFVEKWLS